MNLKKWRKVGNTFLIASILLIFAAMLLIERGPNLSSSCIIMGLMLSGIGLSVNFCFWRCPHCKKKLPMRLSMADEEGLCPNCGKEIS